MTADDEDDGFKCDCGFECEDRVHVVAECPLYKKEREVYVTEPVSYTHLLDWPSVIGPVGTMLRPLEDAWSMV
ncbi:unnamed protein product [Ectocarpus sp. CCAP 1310/34]|nr:unnamed protein product [Ectocarpus sp. CCAP 1310/34]